MKTITLFLCLLAPISAFAQHSYSTSFPSPPAPENPISESGMWTNGHANGLDWGDFVTSAGKAHGNNTTSSCGHNSGNCNDATAAVSGIAWGQDQKACGTVYIDPTLDRSAGFIEIEMRLNVTISAHSITGYEFNYSLKNSGHQYAQIVRWNGPLNSWTQIASNSGTPPALNTGDVICLARSGATLTASRNGATLLTATDSTYLGGAPGMGWFNQTGDLSIVSKWGFTHFSATDSEAIPLPPTNLTATVQ